MNQYSPRLRALVNAGDARERSGIPSYVVGFGLEPADVPDLIRAATDWALLRADSESAEVWGPVHAWRALGELRAEDAVEPILGILNRLDELDDEWYLEELPDVLGEIGPAAVPPVSNYLLDGRNRTYPRICAADCLSRIGRRHPTARHACIEALAATLEQFAANAKTLNGFLILYLVQLSATERQPLIERAFAAGRVDLSIAGDWPMVRAEMRGEPVPPPSQPLWPDLGECLARAAVMPASTRRGGLPYVDEARRERRRERRHRRRAGRAAR